MKKIRVLAVARWPLGGIRTYMRYTYKYLNRDRFNITILASRTAEEEALRKDVEEIGARLVIAQQLYGKECLWWRVYQLLNSAEFDVIQSHGFISAAHVYLGNIIHRLPHVLTVHGIIEERVLGKGIKTCLNKRILKRVVSSADVLYGVSQDILDHVESTVKIGTRPRRIVIHNGIDIKAFVKNDSPDDQSSLRKELGIDESVYLIGYLGRFMPEKGFNYLLDAIEILGEQGAANNLKVLAVGSGDYLSYYRKQVEEKRLADRFIFLPFQRDVKRVYIALDVVVMPSVWEAYPLQPAEAMCMGVPIIASDCIGLREAVKGTPALVVPTRNANAIADAIILTRSGCLRKTFTEFKDEARIRYDVKNTSQQLSDLFDSLK